MKQLAKDTDRDVQQLAEGMLCLICSGLLKIFHFLERILMEHMDMKNDLDSKIQIYSICSIRIRSRK